MATVTAASVSSVGAWSAGGHGGYGRHSAEHGYFRGPAVVAMAPASVAAQTTSTAPTAASHVAIAGFAYSPSTLTVSKGTTATWTNNDSAPHTVTSSGSGSLNSPVLRGGGSYTFTFKTAGTFSYYCNVHPFMHGTVVVK
ncbi:plastocyanin/azurin family copper-binding protein [Streptomyces albospinus]|uniref:plastocyanin/azurin family copper-binding protein n=1 Tax=Streptomyces albospinus TaxID=285515 RepID=UPI00166FBB78|nr:plastocyanin/azurin family copper-binding protein [Streptomyces albospinus]